MGETTWQINEVRGTLLAVKRYAWDIFGAPALVPLNNYNIFQDGSRWGVGIK
jgi:hypothetical protein